MNTICREPIDSTILKAIGEETVEPLAGISLNTWSKSEKNGLISKPIHECAWPVIPEAPAAPKYDKESEAIYIGNLPQVEEGWIAIEIWNDTFMIYAR